MTSPSKDTRRGAGAENPIFTKTKNANASSISATAKKLVLSSRPLTIILISQFIPLLDYLPLLRLRWRTRFSRRIFSGALIGIRRFSLSVCTNNTSTLKPGQGSAVLVDGAVLVEGLVCKLITVVAGQRRQFTPNSVTGPS